MKSDSQVWALCRYSSGERGEREPHERALLERPHSDFAEAIRTIRSGLVLAKPASSPQVVLVTSSVHGEGKTTVATNLALALARIGRVLLIDGDLRDPCIEESDSVCPRTVPPVSRIC